MKDSAAVHEWKEGGLVVFSGLIGMALATMHIYSLGVFFHPLEEEFGWSRAEISGGSVIISVFFIFASPVIGRIVDRRGPRSMAIPGVVLYCSAFALLGMTGPSIWSWWGGWLFLAIGTSCISATVWTLGAARRFDASRGLALALVLAGTGLSSAIVPIVSSILIDRVGWRSTFVLMSGIGLAVVLPVVVLFFRDGPRRGNGVRVLPVRAPLNGFSVGHSIRSAQFWSIGACALLVTIGCLALVVHFVPMLTAQGISRQTAVLAAGLIGVSSIIGRLGTGLLLDRIHGPLVGAVAFAAPSAACILLMDNAGSLYAATVAAVLIGMALGAEIDVIAFLTSRYFGLRNYGVLFGIMNVLLKIGAGLGPLAAGIVFDLAGSYSPLMGVLIAGFLLSAILALSLGRYPILPEHRIELASGEPANSS